MKKIYTKSAEEVLQSLEVTETGLTTEEAAARLAKYGHNKLKEAPKPTLLQRFLTQLKDPMLIILLIESKYVVAKKISITTTTEIIVETAKSSVVKTAEDALRIASKFNLEAEVQHELDNGATPLEALREWDIV